MAVSTDNAFSGPYLANGVTVVFPFNFTAPTAGEVAVEVRDGSGAVVDSPAFSAFVNVGAGGSVVFASAPAAGYSITPYLNPSFTQELQFENGSAWLAEPVNEGYDRAAARDQALKRDVDRSLKAPIGGDGLEFGVVDDGQVLALVGGRIAGIENDPAFAEDAAERAAQERSAAELARNGAEIAEDGAAQAVIDARAEKLAAQAAAISATSAAMSAEPYFPAARSNVPRGITGTGTLTPGSGGTNGTFALAFSGGNFAVNPTGTFTVAGGVVTAVSITGPGLYIGASPTAPTASFAASTGLTGAAVILTVGVLVPAGEYYLTDSASGASYVALFQNVGGVATQVTDPLPWASAGVARDWAEGTPPGGRSSKDWAADASASAASASLASSTVVAPAGLALTGTVFNSGTAVRYWPGTVTSYDRWIDTFTLAVSTAGTIAIVVAFVNTDGTLNLISKSPTYAVVVGAVPLTKLMIKVPAGCVVGFQLLSGNGYFDATGYVNWQTANPPTTNTAVTVGTIGIHWGVTLVGEVTFKARSAYDAIGAKIAQGVIPAVAGANGSTANSSFISQIPFGQAGTLRRISLWSAATGSITLQIVSVVSGVATLQASQVVNVSAGINDITTWTPLVQAGWYLGGYATFAHIHYASAPGAAIWSASGLIGAGVVGASTTLSVIANLQLQLGWEIASGLYLEIANSAGSGGASTASLNAAGLGLLDTADNTGTADATTIFAGARSAHPTPNVPKGTFSITALPYYGEGFWGAGQVSVNGVLVSLPEAPERGSRFLKARSALSTQTMLNGGALMLVGDSTVNGATATTANKFWVNLLTRFLNMGIALDEPVMVNFDTSDGSAAPSFYGVTPSNPATISKNIAAGPVKAAWNLQPGQVINLAAAAYERVEVTYEGVSGGQLTFAQNGTTYSTVSTASSGSDVLSTAGATGQTASRTYTITNSGAVAITITSLMRLGVKAAGSAPRLPVCRFAHGGYKFTDFGTAQITSMKRIADAVSGGTSHFLMTGLGTNDEVGEGLNYAAMKARVTTYINNCIAAGIPTRNTLPIMPWRWSTYVTGGGNYEQGNAGIRDAYREAGIHRFVQTDGYDFIAQGLSANSDGHLNDAGMVYEFNTVVEALCEFGT